MIGSNNKQNIIKTSSDLTSSNNVVTVPAGTYLTDATKTVGSALAAKTYNTSTSNQTIAAGKYLTGKQTIRAVTTSGIEAANIKKDVVIQVGDSASAGRIKNVTGTYEGLEYFGSSAIDSFIKVIYPEGSICTLTNGTITVTAPNTCGTVAFAIPTAGDWTVSCTDGTKTSNKTITITANTIYDIKLNYAQYWYYSGTGWILNFTENSTFHNWRYNNYDTYFTYSSTAPDYGGFVLHTTDTIDVSNFTTAYIEYTMTGSPSANFGIATNSTGTFAASVALTTTSTNTIKSVDITSITGSRYITLSGSVVYGTLTVYNMWLE